MRKSLLFISALAFTFGTVSAAQAQTFTVDSERKTQTTFGTASADARSYFGSHSTGKSKVTMADGTKVKGTWECVAMSQPPGIFTMHIICENTGSSGNYTTVMGCNPLGEDNGISCNGGMRGKSGDYEGRTGSVSFQIKDADATGTGQWHN